MVPMIDSYPLENIPGFYNSERWTVKSNLREALLLLPVVHFLQLNIWSQGADINKSSRIGRQRSEALDKRMGSCVGLILRHDIVRSNKPKKLCTDQANLTENQQLHDVVGFHYEICLETIGCLFADFVNAGAPLCFEDLFVYSYSFIL